MSQLEDYIIRRCEDSDRHLIKQFGHNYIEISELDGSVFTVRLSHDELREHLSVLTYDQLWDWIITKLDCLKNGTR